VELDDIDGGAGGWGDDLPDLNDGEIGEGGGAAPDDLGGDIGGGGWDTEELDLGDLALAGGPASPSGGYYVAPSVGLSLAARWSRDSRLAVDHVAAGSFETAMGLLQRHFGIINFAPLKGLMIALAAGSHAVLSPSNATSAVLSPLLRNAGWPRPVLTLPSLVEKLKLAYSLVTTGKFPEALAAFQHIMAAVTLTHVESRQQLADLKDLLRICREYCTGLRLELAKKKVSEPKRIVELAAYFTHCNLQPAHTMLSLKSAMTLAYKAKVFLAAASFARRLLELNPKPEIATQARKVIQFCEANPSNAFELAYDERNPFVVCNTTFVPIYRGTTFLSCSYCKAPYLPEHKGIVCDTCGLGEVGGEAIGFAEIDADGKPL